MKNDRNEDYFKGLIFAAVEFQNLIKPDQSIYFALSEKHVDESGGRIDNYFIATSENKDKTDIIHEYLLKQNNPYDLINEYCIQWRIR